ncbi:MAG: lactonase family protein [Flavisolibacter sp.]
MKMITLLLLLPIAAAAQKNYLLVGTYTGAGSEGIYMYNFDEVTAEASLVSTAKTSNPSYLAISPDQKFVYAVNENEQGSVSAFRFENGKLTLINQLPSQGAHPCYVDVDKTGKWLAAGNYSSGTFAVLQINSDGSLHSDGSFVQHRGSSITDRQKGPHVHCTLFSPDNEILFVSDLGSDGLFAYPFDETTGKLQKESVTVTKEKAGAGPRHFIINDEGKYAYLVHELSGTVSSFRYDNGKLDRLQDISSLPDGYTGKFTSADIHLSKDGKFLYTTNRDDLNQITIFKVMADGRLERVGFQSTLGKTPRNFSINPSGKYLLVAHQNSNDVVIFRINAETGLLTDTGKRIPVSKPVCLKWIRSDK